jgi:hypothetical protein
MLLSMVQDNLDTDIGIFFFDKAGGIARQNREIDLRPFTQLARQLVDGKLPELGGTETGMSLCIEIAGYLARYGGSEDLVRLRRINDLPSVHGRGDFYIGMLKHRLGALSETVPTAKPEDRGTEGGQSLHREKRGLFGFPWKVPDTTGFLGLAILTAAAVALLIVGGGITWWRRRRKGSRHQG